MPRLWPVLVLALLFAGCTAKGEDDPFAYTRKPLYTGGFDLERIAGQSDQQQFRVGDGSIAALKVQVWVNATAGGGEVQLLDPSGRVVLTTTQTTEQRVPVNLGAWTVNVKGQPASTGHVSVLVTRA